MCVVNRAGFIGLIGSYGVLAQCAPTSRALITLLSSLLTFFFSFSCFPCSFFLSFPVQVWVFTDAISSCSNSLPNCLPKRLTGMTLLHIYLLVRRILRIQIEILSAGIITTDEETDTFQLSNYGYHVYLTDVQVNLDQWNIIDLYNKYNIVDIDKWNFRG